MRPAVVSIAALDEGGGGGQVAEGKWEEAALTWVDCWPSGLVRRGLYS